MDEQGKSPHLLPTRNMTQNSRQDFLRTVPVQQRIITALDVADADTAVQLARNLGDRGRFVKVGLELYAAAGPEVLRRLQQNGKDVFLDLKYHDIPNTVAGAAGVAASLGAAMITIHAAAGRRALAAAAAALARTGGDPSTRPALLAVTVLTSLNDTELAEVAPSADSLAERIVRLATLAVACGCDGIVCSAADLDFVRPAIGPEPLVVTPGIRPADASLDDQKRVATPAAAMAAGADFLVIGRPITQAADPAAVLQALSREIGD